MKSLCILACCWLLGSCRPTAPAIRYAEVPTPISTLYSLSRASTANGIKMVFTYNPADSLRAWTRQQARRDHWSATTQADYLATVPAGGSAFLYWERRDAALAEVSNFLVTVRAADGREVEHLHPVDTSNSTVQQGARRDEHGRWFYSRSTTSFLRQPVRPGYRLEIIDQTIGQRFVFAFPGQ